MNPPSAPATVIEALAASLEAASAGNPNDAEPPVAVLWTDRDSRWRSVVPRLRALMPQLLALGEYRPEERTGPAIRLRCVIDRTLEAPGCPLDTTPIVYLPGAGRQELGVADACPDPLKSLVELQYRGVCWTQRNGRDWTVEAFLTSRDGGGLGLDLARDAATRQSMQRALTALAEAEQLPSSDAGGQAPNSAATSPSGRRRPDCGRAGHRKASAGDHRR